MPVRFVCTQCGQLLSVGSRKAGAHVDCPKCRAELLVPGGSADAGADQDVDASSPEPTHDIDDGIVYEAGRAELTKEPSSDTLVVPRRVVYMQGALLSIVALVSFPISIAS